MKSSLTAVNGAWLILLIATVVAYSPGLHGPFVLDDVLNIAALGDHGGVSNWQTFKAFVFGGYSGPTGRPVSLVTFLIDATNWPAEAYSFKRTNLIIHMINGLLLGAVVAQVLRLLQFDANRARWVVVVSVALWLLHPFLVSTTLYVVQRMAQLSSMFVFAGLAGYLRGRSLLAVAPRKAYVTMTLSLGIFTVLATLSKENGILLPALAGVLEMTVVASQSKRLAALNRVWGVSMLLLPTVAIAIYLVTRAFGSDFFDPAPSRDFSIYERLLTQFRVLADYLWHWLVPDMYTPGVYQDHFVKSTGWFSPVSTIVSALLHLAIISFAVAKRRKWPLFALAALFFYVSHVLESTVLNLELYFEHRNYLAMSFIFLWIVAALIKKLDVRLFALVAMIVVAIFAGFTRHSAEIWSSYETMVEESALRAPGSVRAQARYATILFDSERYNESLQVLNQAITNIPGNHTDLLLNRLVIMCNLGVLDEATFRHSSDRLSGLYFNPGKFFLYRALTNNVASGRCPDVPIEFLRPLYVEMLEVPMNSKPDGLSFSQLNYLIGHVDTYSGNPNAAIAAFSRSLDSDPSAFAAMRMARLLASQHFDIEALQFSERALDELSAAAQSGLADAGVDEAEVRAFESTIRARADSRRDAGTGDVIP